MAVASIHKSVAVVFPLLILQYFGQPLALGVGVVPEVEEEEQENKAVCSDDGDKDWELVGAVLQEEILGDVAGHNSKLDLGGHREKRVVKILHVNTLRSQDNPIPPRPKKSAIQ